VRPPRRDKFFDPGVTPGGVKSIFATIMSWSGNIS